MGRFVASGGGTRRIDGPCPTSPDHGRSPTLAHTQPDAAASRWRRNWLFVKKLLRHGWQISALCPSGRFLCRRCIKYIDFENVRTIVELGAGTGPVTDAIVQRMHPEARFLVIEIDGDFCDVLRQRFPQPNVEILHMGFERLPALLAERGIRGVDYFISGLPTPALGSDALACLLDIVRTYLAPDGAFHQLTHAPFVWKRFYRTVFNDVRFEVEMMNAPPGGVYFCRNVKTTGDLDVSANP